MSALPGSEAAVFAFGPFVLDRDRRLLARDGAVVTVTPKAFDLLVVLVERGGAAVSKDELMTALWPGTAVEESNLTFQISTLRKALGTEGAGCIATLPGRGYQFVAPLQRLPGGGVAAAGAVAQVAAEAVVEDVERTTITVSESRSSAWRWIAALALLVLGAVVAAVVLRRDRAPSPPIQSLAVLPFKPLGGAQRDEALELGMADTLITRLSRMPAVTVSPISAVRRYSRLDDDPLAAGRQLGVDAVVDGSIQRRGPRMRVTVRLLRTSDGKPMWASQLDETASDLFAVQDLVAERVARAVVPALSEPAEAQLARRTTTDLEAYELYLKGRYWANAEPARAEEFFQRAVARDPNFATAWAAIADTWLMRGRYGNSSPRQQFDKARQAAMKAVALDPESAEGHAALAEVYADHDWDWKRAEGEYRRALELNPSSDVAHGQFAYLLLFRRDFEGALEHARRATEIDPLSPLWAIGLGFILDSAGRHEEAIRSLEETLRVHPGLTPALLHLGMAYTNAGKPEMGVAKFQEALVPRPRSAQLLGLLAFAQARAGHRDAALSIVHDLEKRAGHEAVGSPNLALAWTALGNHDRAFYWLERGYADRLFLLRVVTVQPGFDPLRSDPRYADLMRRMGLDH
jgi:DNA-binding winged helix-turn-helix (wHTH) protein/TolB-like protein/tetratricopeptide (TPR) repeat protein